jgi:hypothetical protein
MDEFGSPAIDPAVENLAKLTGHPGSASSGKPPRPVTVPFIVATLAVRLPNAHRSNGLDLIRLSVSGDAGRGHLDRPRHWQRRVHR